MSVKRALAKVIHHPNGSRPGSRDVSPHSGHQSPHRRSTFASIFHGIDKASISGSEYESSDDDSDNISKNAQKREHKRQQRDAKARLSLESRENSEMRSRHRIDEASKHETEEQKSRYGDLPLMQSTSTEKEDRIKLESITEDMIGQTVTFRARLHHARHMGQKLVFLLFRQQIHTIQGVLHESDMISPVMVHWAEHIEIGCILRVTGVLGKPQTNVVKSASIHHVEIHITELKVITRRADPGELPLLALLNLSGTDA